MTSPLPDWPRARGETLGPAEFRRTPEAFEVEELLPFSPQGEGEHLWLWLEKRAISTPVLVRHVARRLGVAQRDIGVSGLKDHTAVTRQWLSVWLPGRETPADIGERLALEDGASRVRLRDHARHPRKLKRGVHRANRFRLWLEGEALATPALETRWQQLVCHGVPNYFGPQRFGAGGDNVARAERLFQRGWRRRDDRDGLLLSSARSFLFNALLAQRVTTHCWDTALSGEVYNLAGSASHFSAEEVDATLRQRLATGDIHPTGALWGRGRLESRAAVAEMEQAIADQHSLLRDGIEQAGARPARRALRLMPEAAALVRHEHGVELIFSLVRGGFATAILRELIAHPRL